MALLIALIFNRWAQIKTLSIGLKSGFMFGVLYTLSMNFFMYSSQLIDANFFSILAFEFLILSINGRFFGFVNGGISSEN